MATEYLKSKTDHLTDKNKDMDAAQTQNRPRRQLRVLLFSAALTPFLCAVVAHAVGANAQQPAQREEPPALVFEQYMVNLSEVPPIPVLEGMYRFTNRSNRVVTIKELKPSCGCLNPRLEKRIYQPGESGQFSVRVETAGEEPGPKDYFINVSYEDSRPRQVQLSFKFILPERKIVIRPRALIFYQLGSGATSREIVVTDFREQTLQIVDVACKSPFVSAGVIHAGTTRFGHYEIRISVTVADGVPPGKHETLLKLKTNDPQYPVLHVPLWIHGPDKPRPQTAVRKRPADSARK
ncbi:MAG: DUF1573 domain-containing protein [Planctomycetes bacterium]|nr:DUF1573 domain-containing protein [Planctomycetota bacterium]